MDDLPLIGLRSFRMGVTTIEAPVRVVYTKGGVRPLGTWVPEGYRITGLVKGGSPRVSSGETGGDEPHPERSGKRE